MVHGGDPDFIGQHSQVPLPNAHAVAPAAAAVGIDQKSLGGRIAASAATIAVSRHRKPGVLWLIPEVHPP